MAIVVVFSRMFLSSFRRPCTSEICGRGSCANSDEHATVSLFIFHITLLDVRFLLDVFIIN